MKKTLTLLTFCLSFWITAQDFTAAALLNFEFTLDNQLVPYEQLTIIDPSANPPDTITVLNIQRNFVGAFLGGSEVIYPQKDVYQWICTLAGNVNTVSVLDPFIPTDTVVKDIFYSDSQSRDTLATTYLDNGSGTLEANQELRIAYSAQGVSSVDVYSITAGIKTLFAKLDVKRNSIGQADSIEINANFNGTFIPVQLFEYIYNQNRLDSVLLYDYIANPTSPEEILVMRHNASNLINRVTAYEMNSGSGEFEPYEIYLFTPRADLNTAENKLASLSTSPNPAVNFLRLNNTKKVDVSLYDVSGKVIRENLKIAPQEKINVEDLRSGMYILKVKSSKGLQTIKWQKL